MKQRSSWLRVVGINILVLFVLANVLYWTIPVVELIAHLTRHRNPLSQQSEEAVVRRETALLATRYLSFIEWRREVSKGAQVNVEGPYRQRRTVNTATDAEPSVYFFGGSTIWGTGVGDSNTVPSHFAKLTGIHTENFGESAYTAHQSLVFLLQVLEDGRRPSVVVFYDGVNEVLHKCRRELTPYSHSREKQLQGALSRPPRSFAHYFEPVLNVASLAVRTGGGDFFDCDKNPEKAALVAGNLIRDWELARILVEARGGKFLALLQPVSYLSLRTPLNGIDMPADLGRQYQAVYPLIRSQLEKSGAVDMVAALDRPQPFYIDFSHLNGAGNALIADHIRRLLPDVVASQTPAAE